jgi:hypothetical protein
MNNVAAIRTLIIYAVCLPLAIVLGYLISDPLDRWTDSVLGVVLMLLLLPLLLRWYHAWLIAVWNMAIVITFLPGYFQAWIPLAGVAFCIALGHYSMNRDRKFLEARSVGWSLVFLAIVVAVTAKFRGGLGFRAFGDDSVGGKRYLWIWMAIVGYFALVSQPIPPEKRKFYTNLFVLGAVTVAISSILGYLGPAFSFLYIFFPTTQSSPGSNPLAEISMQEFGGVAFAGGAVAYALVARYGIEGALNLRKFWRPLLFLLAVGSTFFGGYRSTVILTGMTLMLVFYFEGLLRSRLMPVMVLCTILVGGLVVSFSDRLPLPCQRCLAFLPLKIAPIARMSADASSDWRLGIWQSLLPQIPRYLLLGKGLTFDASDMAMYQTLGQSQVGGLEGGQLTLAGDYHNGPLSLIIPFGLAGVIGFLWFLVASLKVLWANYKYGDPDIRNTNTWVLSYFIAKTVLFFVVFGGFYGDLVTFVGLIGFSVSLNGGVATPAPATQSVQVFNRFRPFQLARPATSS